VDDHVGELQAAAGAQDAVDLVEGRVLVGHESMTPLEITTSPRRLAERFDSMGADVATHAPPRSDGARSRHRVVHDAAMLATSRSSGGDEQVARAAHR